MRITREPGRGPVVFRMLRAIRANPRSHRQNGECLLHGTTCANCVHCSNVVRMEKFRHSETSSFGQRPFPWQSLSSSWSCNQSKSNSCTDEAPEFRTSDPRAPTPGEMEALVEAAKANRHGQPINSIPGNDLNSLRPSRSSANYSLLAKLETLAAAMT
jgi:hypothetical protein